MVGEVGAIVSWDEIKLLSVSLDGLTRWHHPDLLAIGDAAHAVSPVGGIGINLAVQGAVAALAGAVERAPWPLKLLQAAPGLQRIPARVLGLGIRREHIRSPDAGLRR